MGITRRQLKEFGATDYLSNQLLKPLQPAGKQGRAYEYEISQVLDAIRRLSATPRLRKTTLAKLLELEVHLSRMIPVTPTPDPDLLEIMQRASVANTRFEQTARQARKAAGEFKAYKKAQGSDFNPKNNIVVFAT